MTNVEYFKEDYNWHTVLINHECGTIYVYEGSGLDPERDLGNGYDPEDYPEDVYTYTELEGNDIYEFAQIGFNVL